MGGRSAAALRRPTGGRGLGDLPGAGHPRLDAARVHRAVSRQSQVAGPIPRVSAPQRGQGRRRRRRDPLAHAGESPRKAAAPAARPGRNPKDGAALPKASMGRRSADGFGQQTQGRAERLLPPGPALVPPRLQSRPAAAEAKAQPAEPAPRPAQGAAAAAATPRIQPPANGITPPSGRSPTSGFASSSACDSKPGPTTTTAIAGRCGEAARLSRRPWPRPQPEVACENLSPMGLDKQAQMSTAFCLHDYSGPA